MGIHRAELVDLDRLVVEAVPLLLEDDRAGRGGFDSDCRAKHDRPQEHQGDQAEEDVEAALGNGVPIGNRLVEDVEHGDIADMGVAARAETQIVGVGGEPDVDRQDPELLQKLQNALLRRQRQRDDQHVDARQARELHGFVDRSKFR